MAFNISTYLDDRIKVIRKIEEGLSYNEFSQIKGTTAFKDKEWANFIDVTERSFQRYKQEETHVFKPEHSERIFEIAEVTQVGKEVFGDFSSYYDWLKTPSFALGNEKPIDLLKSSYGKDLVIGELKRIDHGIFS